MIPKKIAYNYLINSSVKGCFIVYCFEARYYKLPALNLSYIWGIKRNVQ